MIKNSVWKSWEASNVQCLEEYMELPETLPCHSHKKLWKETFYFEPCHLNLAACSLEALPKVEPTMEVKETKEFDCRMRYSTAELCDLNHTPLTSSCVIDSTSSYNKYEWLRIHDSPRIEHKCPFFC